MKRIRPFIIDSLRDTDQLIGVIKHTCDVLWRAGIVPVKPIIWTHSDAKHPLYDIRYIPKMDIGLYSDFCVRSLGMFWPDSIHGLCVQHDGFPINERGWRDSFMDFDYIGAPWPEYFRISHRVGNGGFSLRSAKLMRACVEHIPTGHSPEDVRICVEYGDLLFNKCGIRFAPVDVAARFSCEFDVHERRWPEEECFGFHSWNSERLEKYKPFVDK